MNLFRSVSLLVGCFSLLLLKNLSAQLTVSQEAFWKASNTGGGDRFGGVIAIDGDLAVVGARSEDSSTEGVDAESDDLAADTGAAYLFRRNQLGIWEQEAFLKSFNPDDNDFFGWSVGVSGNIVVVGAIGEESASSGANSDASDNSLSAAGAVYVFEKNFEGEWIQSGYLKPSLPRSSMWFGWSVDISGETIVVGAHGESGGSNEVNGDESDISKNRAGAAYVFGKDSEGEWKQEAYLKASNSSSNSDFGFAVSIDGSLIAIGAPAQDSGGLQSGAVYVFGGSGSNWSQQAFLKASNTGSNDAFGEVVDISGTTLVVGASGEDGSAQGVNGVNDNGFSSSGAAYIFTRQSGPGAIWSEVAYLKASNTEAGDRFGGAVGVWNDIVVVGAKNESSSPSSDGGELDNTLSGAGAVYVFSRDSLNVWRQSQLVKASNAGQGDTFGTSVSISTDTLICGAPGEASSAMGVDGDQDNNSISLSGAVYSFDVIPSPEITVFVDELELVSGVSVVDFGIVASGSQDSVTLRIENIGNESLLALSLVVEGSDDEHFSFSQQLVGEVVAGGNQEVQVSLSPQSSLLPTRVVTARLDILSNDLDENPFSVFLSGTALSRFFDSDSDGLNDAAEFSMRELGFDWELPQEHLVSILFNNSGLAGLFTESEIGILFAPNPIVRRSMETGKVALKMDWRMSINLEDFFDLPAEGSQLSVDESGDVIFSFEAVGEREFFQVEVGS